jgi:NAD(P)-dependent dehydrogenase (short-subunit alcohol dehydrogenase family)
MSLTGKVAVVTGAAGEVGAAVVRVLLTRGAQLLAVDRDEASLARLSAELDGVETWIADVSKGEDVATYVGRALDLWGGIDLFFNNSDADGPAHPLADYPEADFDAMIAANLRPIFLGLKHALPHIRNGGAVVNLASELGVVGAPGLGGYVASKHGVLGLTKVAALECERRDIRVNAVCPSRSPEIVVVDSSAPEVASDEVVVADGYDTPEDVALLVAFLLSDGGPTHHRVDVLAEVHPEALEGRPVNGSGEAMTVGRKSSR